MWNWTETYSPGIGFAIWVLEHDGLRIHPFDMHPEGDGRLRALGLNESSWRLWIGAITEAEAGFADFVPRHDIRALTPGEREEMRRRDEQREPVWCWAGESRVQTALDELWLTYRTIGEGWISQLTSAKRQSRITADEERRLWRQLEPLHDRLATLRVYPVDYGHRAELAIPPESCLVSIGARDADGTRYADSVFEAARQLASIKGEEPTAS
jgi:hypothetical protein